MPRVDTLAGERTYKTTRTGERCPTGEVIDLVIFPTEATLHAPALPRVDITIIKSQSPKWRIHPSDTGRYPGIMSCRRLGELVEAIANRGHSPRPEAPEAPEAPELNQEELLFASMEEPAGDLEELENANRLLNDELDQARDQAAALQKANEDLQRKLEALQSTRDYWEQRTQEQIGVINKLEKQIEEESRIPKTIPLNSSLQVAMLGAAFTHMLASDLTRNEAHEQFVETYTRIQKPIEGFPSRAGDELRRLGHNILHNIKTVTNFKD